MPDRKGLSGNNPFLIFRKNPYLQTRILFMLMALTLGAILPVQSAINARPARTLSSPMSAAFVSFAVGAPGLLVFFAGSQTVQCSVCCFSPCTLVDLDRRPAGHFFCQRYCCCFSSLGTVLSFTLVLPGQMIAAIIMDQFGLLGLSIREISMGRIAGVILLIGGVVLIRKF